MEPRKKTDQPLFKYALALAATGVALLVRLALTGFFGAGLTYITFYPAVMLAALLGGLGAGLAATALSALAATSLILLPHGQSLPASFADALGLAMFGAMGAFMSVVAEWFRRAQEAARENAEKFRHLADAMPHLVWSARADGTVDYYNGRRKEFTGFHQEPDGTWRWEAVLHAEDIEPTVAAWDKAFRTGTPYELEHRIQRADGSFRWHLSRATPVRAEGGKIVRWYGTATDIEDLKRTETELRQNEERLRAFFQNASVGALETDLDSYIIEVNDRFCRITGYDREELIGKTPHDLTHPEDRPREMEGFRKLLKGESNLLDIEKRYVHKDGTCLWVQESTGLIFDKEGRMQRLAALVQDISERKKAEAERERLLAELEATIRAIPSGVIIYGLQGELLRLNPAAEAMLGYSEETKKKPFRQRKATLEPLTDDGRPYPLEEHPALKALRGETIHSEIIAYQRSGAEKPLWVTVSAAPISLGDGTIIGAVSTMIDITRLHELQKEREMTIHTISHDLRTPLTLVLGHAELLGTICREETSGLHVQGIVTGAERMEAMIEDLVEAARLEGGEIVLEKEPLALDRFIAKLLERASAGMDTSRVAAFVSPQLPAVDADPGRLERILINLLTNALKYSPPESPVEIRACPQGPGIAVSVRDRGQGIQATDLPHIFDRFYRPKNGRKAGSVGLGLFITRSLVEAHGGWIRVESEPGAGTTFTFTLPAA